jgi:hypothetical protein
LHTKINRTLATIALVLGIVLMAAVLFISVAAYQKASAMGDALGNLGGDTTSEVLPTEPDIVQPGDPGYEPYCYETEFGEEICE